MKNSQLITVPEACEEVARLAKAPIQRKELIVACVNTQNLTDKQKKDKRPGAPLNVLKCRFGDAIEQLLSNGTLVQNPDKTLVCKSVESAKSKIRRDEIIERAISEKLGAGAMSKKALYSAVAAEVKKELPKEAPNTQVVNSDTGRILSTLVKAKVVDKNDDGYILHPHETKEQRNARLLDTISDERLVQQSVLMLAKWLESNSYIDVEGESTDGPQDGGIDGVLTAVDALGYKERIIVQVKNFHNKKNRVKPCDMREFCGVLAQDGSATKGLFVTSSKFHPGAAKFAKDFKYKYLALIDGEKWLQLAANCGYEITED